MNATLDWAEAERHLQGVRRQYVDIGVAGLLGLRLTLDPLLVRYERGERTPDLHAEIMAVE